MLPASSLATMCNVLKSLPVLPPIRWGLLGARLAFAIDDMNTAAMEALVGLMSSAALARNGGRCGGEWWETRGKCLSVGTALLALCGLCFPPFLSHAHPHWCIDPQMGKPFSQPWSKGEQPLVCLSLRWRLCWSIYLS